MWENETIVLVTSLKKRILNGNNKARFGNLSKDEGLPEFIKDQFRQRVEFYLDKESPLSFKSTTHFQLDEDAFVSMRGRFLEIVRDSAIFHTDEVESILQEILVLRLDYLVKPIDTMRRILFENHQSIEMNEAKQMLVGYSNVLPYSKDLIKNLEDKGESSLNRESYATQTSILLENRFEDQPVKTISQEFTTLTDFVSETKGEEIKHIEGALLHDFFSDRNLWGFKRALEVEMKLGREDFNLLDVEMMLKRYLELKEEFSQETTEKSEMKTVPVEPLPESSDKDVTELEIPPETEENGWDLEDVLGDETFDVEAQAEPEVKDEIPEEPAQKKNMRIIRHEKENEKAEETKSVEPQEPVVESTTGLNQLIDNKTQRVFTKKLFGNDKEAYESLIEKLDEAESWRVAKILIDNELFKRDVDPFSREAIKLVDLVYSRYYPEEGVGGAK